jgi:class 3 adenylate cyclase
MLNNYEPANRQQICFCISIAMMLIMLVQSFKLLYVDDFNSILLHISNMSIHFIVFAVVLKHLKHNQFYKARNLLIIGFCSYLSIACLLWEYNLGVQQYFLLALFISIYLIGRDEVWRLTCTLGFEVLAFIGFSAYLPRLSHSHLGENQHSLLSIAQTNNLAFAVSCCVCALFIRMLLSKNWQILRAYKKQQAQLISHLLPKDIAEALLLQSSAKSGVSPKVKILGSCNKMSKQQRYMDEKYQHNHQTPFDYELEDTSLSQRKALAVMFIDICGFTDSLVNNEDESRKSTYSLFSQIDTLCASFNAKRVKTNGDQYILTIGISAPNLSKQNICEQAVLLSAHTMKLCQQQTKISIRIGLGFGEVVFGVFDINSPAFDIWGETVVRASRLESHAKANEILVDEHIHRSLSDKYHFGRVDKIFLKGIGLAKVYSLRV